MFGLGMPEILLILAIALIVVGPQKLPELGRTIGKAMNEFKKAAQDFKRNIDVETTVKDIKDIKLPKTDLKTILKEAVLKDDSSSTPPEQTDPVKTPPEKDHTAEEPEPNDTRSGHPKS